MVRDADVPPVEPLWPSGSPGEPPAPGEVQVWLADLDRPPIPRQLLYADLAPDERERAARFRFDVHRHRFIAGRGLLRRILAPLLGVEPGEVVFRYGAKGKPSLARPEADLTFNLSHSANGALFALSRGAELGVDLEALRPLSDADALVERFFHPREREVYVRRPAEERLTCFYCGWTRKEAYVKARGDGLSLPTTAFEVVLVPGEPAGMLGFEAEPGEVERWSFAALEPARGFLGALAVEGPPPELVARFWVP